MPATDVDLTGPALAVAPGLLGCQLTSRIDGERVTIRLVEVEAYEGSTDPGSHAHRGMTARNAAMFDAGGRLYVYRHLGLHHCVNLVCGPAGSPSAVLLRAGEVIAGQDVAWRRREAAGVCRRGADLARGPGRLAVALGLSVEHNALVLDPHGEVSLTDGLRPPRTRNGPRVGVNGPGGDPARYPWRFWIDGDACVSTYRSGTRLTPS